MTGFINIYSKDGIYMYLHEGRNDLYVFISGGYDLYVFVCEATGVMSICYRGVTVYLYLPEGR